MEESLQEETLSEWLTTPGNPEKAWKKKQLENPWYALEIPLAVVEI